MKEGKNGVTKDTAKKILFGAGTYHKGLKCTDGSWNFAESCIGATSGGGKITIEPEFSEVEIDGMNVAVKGISKVKTGEKATMEINPIELTADLMKAATIGKEGVSDDEEYTLIESKPDIEEGDYWENVAFVGKTLEGKNIIAIMENALCTSGFGIEGKKKEGSVPSYTFECHADINDSDELDTLPWHIYYPKAV